MPTHPLWRPFELVELESKPATVKVDVVPPDPEWPTVYRELEAGIRAALGAGVLAVDHVGSTSVPGLWAKPIIDIDLTVADPTDEDAYVPALLAAGWTWALREPDFEEHRLLRHPSPAANLHVFGPGAREVARQAAFRDWLRTHPDDHAVYAARKQELAQTLHPSGMAYNNEKAPLIYDIYERIFTADPAYPHDPQPREGA